MFTLYFAHDTCALAPYIALEEVGADYKVRLIDFAKNEQQSEDYLSVNPKGRVPALVTSEGILTETPAILAFIVQYFPAANLAPINDPFAFAQFQSVNSYICSTLHVNHAHGGRAYRWAKDEKSFADMKRKVPETVTASFQMIEREMLKGPWLLGDQYSASDVYLFTVSQWLERDGVNPLDVPGIIDHRNRVGERVAVKKIIAKEFG